MRLPTAAGLCLRTGRRRAVLPEGQGADGRRRAGGRRYDPQRKTDMKRTYQPSKIRRARTHGFLVRMKTRGGRKVLNARRAKGRKRIAL